MVEESSSSRKKVSINEEDTATLLQRYSTETVLTLLQEVSQNAGEKIDWNALMKNTTTGISCAREYQALWRHLAYGHTLIDQINEAEIPLDDDSDLEIEQETCPPVSREASAEAAAYVKVLMASGCTKNHESQNTSYIEAPLTINIPNIKALTVPSDSSFQANGTNITIPVYVQVEKQSGTAGDKRPISETSGVNVPPRRKRRVWSTEEDMKLTAAVQKYGEQNWAPIVNGDFMNDRKASELAQRWSNLKRKQGNSNGGSSSQVPETQLAAAHRAMSLALDMPMSDNLKASCHINSVGTKPLHQPKKASAPPLEHRLGTVAPPKSQVKTERPSANPTPRPDSMIKAAAIAAGARIGTSADTASLIGTARSQNVVHIKTGGNSLIKPPTLTNQLPTNVHFIRDGLAKAPISVHSANKPNVSRPGGTHQGQIKPVVVGLQCNPIGTAPVLNKSSAVAKSTVSISSVGPVKKEDVAISTSRNEMKEVAESDQRAAGVSSCEAPVDQLKKVEGNHVSVLDDDVLKGSTRSSEV